MIYEIHTRQKLPISKQEAWDFLSDPKNLQEIMPDEMGFEIMSGADRKMFTGQLLQYKVTPLPGFKTKWVTEITHVQKPDYFVDIQLYGPYALWHHKHFIHEIEGGVEIEDLVHYKIPFGILGRMMHPILVKPKLNEIFKAREAKMVEKFGQY
ncbi:SRPBCC family protein [Psychroflexus gondwanensis]|jgi:ligand-binding SRPBCC domain-containing protein|uniref:SRPBCC superfamily protein n=1 Tax=Psychroflexus gondwanensis ACAM 44 TaxID=1189619 RepID=N1X233_9FLAO|nr:SRPBCC family protein [Psychroflexus gondwanensis]EMY82118.1 SRPBCC superfamily protein [Psychroflexus gondwanensis ACAM 44]TXE20139.1 SRPBCC family protein [Psychroflexus gondwanensis]